MGLFDRFKKQDCEICGKEVGMFGYKKLADGEICKDCVKLLSPWFEDRKGSTVAQIKDQIAYRERNAKEHENFTISRKIGDEEYFMYIEEVGGVPTRFFVTSRSDYKAENPDIISFKDVVSCVTDIEVRDEEMKQKDSEGRMVSYNPPRYKHHHNFYIKMQIRNNPYFDDLKFCVNRAVVTLESVGGFGAGVASAFLKGAGVSNTRFSSGSLRDIQEQRRFNEFQQMCQIIEQAVEDGKRGAQPVAAAPVVPVAQAVPVQAAPVQAAPKPKFCPNCGAPAGAGKFCEHCGSKLG